MKTTLVVLVLFCLVFLASVNAEAPQAIKTPAGCAPVLGAEATESGWADRVVHEKSGIELVFIPAGTFTMGSNSPAPYEVKVALYYIGRTEVTNAQYRRFLEASGYDGKPDTDENYDLHLRHFRGESLMSADDNYPIVWVSWHNARAFCSWAGLALPSEAQWEWACRAGTTTRYYYGDDESKFGQYGWAIPNGGGFTHPVAQKKPNAWGIHDMHGNVWEWAEDDFAFDHYPHPQIARPNDGSARIEGRLTKSLRGGSWSNTTTAYVSGSNGRSNSAAVNARNNVGFRVVMPLKGR